LCHLFDRGQPIEPGHQRVVQRIGNGQQGERLQQLIMVLPLPQQARLQHHLGQLFDKQGDAIGLSHHVPAHLGRQRLARRQPRHYGLDLGAR
jgi:hypothetical protein